MVFLVNMILVVIIGLIGIYMYHFIKRILNLLFKNKNSKYKRIINILLTVIIMIPTLSMSTMWVLLVILHVLVISLIMDLIHFITCKVSKKKKEGFEKLYNSGVIPIIISSIILSYGYINMHTVVKTNYTMYTDKAIRDNGYKVAFISDLHYGVSMNGEELKEKCSRLEKEKADFIILGGDIVDESTTKEGIKEAFEILSQIKSTYGVFYVYGNHDRASYSVNANFTEKELSKVIEESGITILKDEIFDINNEITITGRGDKSFFNQSSRKSAEELVEDTILDKNKYNILIDHQPCEFGEVSSSGYDVMMSGHTHAGQIWPGGMFIKYVMNDTFDYGYIKKDNLDVIVSSGIAGWKFPIRTEEHSEYVILDILPNK